MNLLKVMHLKTLFFEKISNISLLISGPFGEGPGLGKFCVLQEQTQLFRIRIIGERVLYLRRWQPNFDCTMRWQLRTIHTNYLIYMYVQIMWNHKHAIFYSICADWATMMKCKLTVIQRDLLLQNKCFLITRFIFICLAEIFNN